MGECFGLLGPNGAGKTTTVEILEGLTPLDEGSVEVLGQKWGAGDDQRLRERLGVQLQETQFADKLSVEETLRLFRSFYRSGREGDYALTVSEIGVALPALLAEFDRRGVEIVTMTTHQATLEDVFVSLTGRMLRDA
jgi:ABC-type Na+ transport system ATPase subunit NatA